MTTNASRIPGHFFLSALVGLALVVAGLLWWQVPMPRKALLLGLPYGLALLFYLGAVLRPQWYWRGVSRWYHTLASPRYFYQKTGRWLPWLVALAVLLLGTGLLWGLLFAPPHWEQGNSYRIIYLHVPAASGALMGYTAMAVCGFVALVWRLKMAEIVLKAIAPFGAVLAAVALISGAVWGKPTWGTYWIWDARLTSMLILFFMYLGIMALLAAIQEPRQAARAASLLALVGVINVVIVRYSVEWWHSLHQPASLSALGAGSSAIHPSMLAPLLISLFGTYFLFAVTVLIRARTELLWRERRSAWVKEMMR